MKEIDNPAKCYEAPSVKVVNISAPSPYAASPTPGAAGGYDSKEDIDYDVDF